jgi:hypothetical protein
MIKLALEASSSSHNMRRHVATVRTLKQCKHYAEASAQLALQASTCSSTTLPLCHNGHNMRRHVDKLLW